MRRLILLPLFAVAILANWAAVSATINLPGGKYVGEVKDGEPNGQGSFFGDFYDDKISYQGEWKDGKRHGQGTSYNPDGSIIYQGGFKDGKQHGQGILYRKDGSIDYQGDWCNDEQGPCQ